MKGLLDINNPVISALDKNVNMVFLSLVWFACCLPIVTAGASTTAFYYTIRKNIVEDRGYSATEFFHSFKENFRMSTISWLIILAMSAVFLADSRALYILEQSGFLSTKVHGIFYLLLMMIAVYAIWCFAYIARFRDTLKQTLKNAMLMMLGHLFPSLGIFAIIAGTAALIYLIPILVFLVPSVSLWFISMLTERAFRRASAEA